MDIELIITGGDAPSVSPLLKYSKIIACDSGYDTAKALGLKPNVIIGDFDSTKYKSEILKLNPIVYERDKDYSDTELAIRSLTGKRYDLLGGGGGRVDHLLSILSLFNYYPAPRFWFTKTDFIISCIDNIVLSVIPSIDISIFPLSNKEAHVTSQGLFWPLDKKVISHSFISLSNRTNSSTVMLSTDNPIFIRFDIKHAKMIIDNNTHLL